MKTVFIILVCFVSINLSFSKVETNLTDFYEIVEKTNYEEGIEFTLKDKNNQSIITVFFYKISYTIRSRGGLIPDLSNSIIETSNPENWIRKIYRIVNNGNSIEYRNEYQVSEMASDNANLKGLYYREIDEADKCSVKFSHQHYPERLKTKISAQITCEGKESQNFVKYADHTVEKGSVKKLEKNPPFWVQMDYELINREYFTGKTSFSVPNLKDKKLPYQIPSKNFGEVEFYKDFPAHQTRPGVLCLRPHQERNEDCVFKCDMKKDFKNVKTNLLYLKWNKKGPRGYNLYPVTKRSGPVHVVQEFAPESRTYNSCDNLEEMEIYLIDWNHSLIIEPISYLDSINDRSWLQKDTFIEFTYDLTSLNMYQWGGRPLRANRDNHLFENERKVPLKVMLAKPLSYQNVKTFTTFSEHSYINSVKINYKKLPLRAKKGLIQIISKRDMSYISIENYSFQDKIDLEFLKTVVEKEGLFELELRGVNNFNGIRNQFQRFPERIRFSNCPEGFEDKVRRSFNE